MARPETHDGTKPERYCFLSDSGRFNYFPIAISKNERSILSMGRFGINWADSEQNEDSIRVPISNNIHRKITQFWSAKINAVFR